MTLAMLAGTAPSVLTAIEFAVAGAAMGAAKTAVNAVKAAKIPKARMMVDLEGMCGLCCS